MKDTRGYLDRLNSRIGLTPSGRSPANKNRHKIRKRMLRMIRKVDDLRPNNFELNKNVISPRERDLIIM